MKNIYFMDFIENHFNDPNILLRLFQRTGRIPDGIN
jgi:hypothetical protein